MQRLLQKVERVETSSNTWPYPKTIPLLRISNPIEEDEDKRLTVPASMQQLFGYSAVWVKISFTVKKTLQNIKYDHKKLQAVDFISKTSARADQEF